MHTHVEKIGMREFRTHLPHYLQASSPVAITRHGETIGFYIPTRPHPKKTHSDTLKNAAAQIENLLLSLGTTEDELVAEFHSLRTTQKKK